VETIVEVKQLDELVADAGEDVTVIIDADLVNSGHELMGSTTGGKEPFTYYWFEGNFNNPNLNQADHVGQNWIVYPEDETTYTLLVVDACGAESVDQVTVSVQHRDDNWVYCNPERTKVAICHLLGNGRYNLICVNLHAVPAHMNHGDEPFGGQCSKPGGGPKNKNKSAEIETSDLTYETKLLTYPNPFSGSATVSFTTETDGNVIVRIIDMTGKEVKMLYSGNSYAGQQHNIMLQADNMLPGFYFCVLQLENGTVKTEKLIYRK
jgi:hypothetical protein